MELSTKEAETWGRQSRVEAKILDSGVGQISAPNPALQLISCINSHIA